VARILEAVFEADFCDAAMAAHATSTKPAPSAPLELPGHPRMVQAAAAADTVAAPDSLRKAFWPRRSGEPIAGNPHDGF
jgi:hypothetical protein